MIRYAAHRDAVAAGILRSRRERQLERARRDQRILVEHLVEIAHAEEHDGVAILLLRIEILPHRGRDAPSAVERSPGTRTGSENLRSVNDGIIA